MQQVSVIENKKYHTKGFAGFDAEKN